MTDRTTATRRRFLGGCAAVGSALLAGCWGSRPEYVEFTVIDDAELGRRVAETDHGREQLVATLAEHGTAASTESEPPFSDGEAVAAPDGSVHEVRAEETADRWTSHRIGFEHVEEADPTGTDGDASPADTDDASSTDGDAAAPIDAEELPSTDRAVLEAAFAGTDGPVELADGTVVAARQTRVGSPAERTQSVLLDADGGLLAYRGETYRVHVRTRAVAPVKYEYAATRLAPHVEAYGRQLRSQHAVELTDLSESEREVVEEAIDGRCDREDVSNEPFDAVVERIRRRDPVEGEAYRGSWIVRYDGATYWANVESH